MEYTKIKISSTDAPYRLYRVLLVRDDLLLPFFAQVIMAVFQMMDAHLYEFQSKDRRFVLEIDEDLPKNNEVLMKDYRISDLGEKSSFIYDFGDWWEFDVKVYRGKVKRVESDPVILKEGKGAGIFEDDRSVFLSYIAGAVSPVSRNTYPERGPALPWNLGLRKFGDFDAPLDLESYQEEIDEVMLDLDEDWYHYENLLDAAYDAWDDGHGSDAFLQAFDEYEKTCERLRKEMRLPETTEELFQDEEIPDSACDIFVDLPMALISEGRYQDLYDVLQRMSKLFKVDGICKNLQNYHMFYALRGIGQAEEAYEHAEDWFEREKDNPFAAAVMIETLSDLQKHKEADELIQRFTRDGDEYDMKYGAVFASAIAYYRRYGNIEKAQELTSRIEDAREEDDEFMEELSDPEEEYDYLGEAVEAYKKTAADQEYMRVGEAMCLAIVTNAPVYPEVDYMNDSGTSFHLVEIAGHKLMPVYSSPESAEKLGYEVKVQISLRHIHEITDDMDVDGLLIDPDFEKPLCVLPLELVKKAVDALPCYDDEDDGYEEDEIDPSMLN
ncbi:MAG: hypothetical protein IKE16_02925 [Solobacterium sp.]|nr:hypothetical protein [Solobacterium sp.]